MKKTIPLLLCIFLLVSLLVCPASAANQEQLTATACYLINDQQIVVEFSEPVKIGSTEPYIAIRYVTDEGVLAWDGEVDTGTPLQFPGSWSWVDETHNRIVWTLPANNMEGATSIIDIIEHRGNLEKYKEYTARFSFEEVRYDDSDIYNFGICNIVSVANEDIELAASLSKPGWQDGLYLKIVENYNYKLPGNDKVLQNAADELGILAAPKTSETIETAENIAYPENENKNIVTLPIWALIASVAGAVVVSVGIACIIYKTRMKGI